MYQPLIYRAVRQKYRHFVQQQIVQQEMRCLRPASKPSLAWEAGGMAALFSAAATCGTLAQIHLSQV